MVGQPLIVQANGQALSVLPAALQNQEHCSQLVAQLNGAGGHVIFDLQHLLDWSDAECWSVLAFIIGLNISPTLRVGEFETPGIFEAVLTAMEGAGDVRRCGRGVQAAINAAAMIHSHSAEWPAACTRIMRRLKQLGVTSYNQADLKRLLRQRGAAAQVDAAAAEPELILVRDVLPEAPIADNVVIPGGWLLSAAGIAKGSNEDAEEATGITVRLPEWKYPVVCNPATGELRYDNFNGSWGDPAQLDRFLQIYSVERAKIEARRQGHSVTEQPLADGSIKLTINVGGAA